MKRAIWSICLSICALSYAEDDLALDPLFDFSTSEFQESVLPKIQKERIQKQPRNGLPAKKYKMSKDRRAILHGHVQDSSLKWSWGKKHAIKYDRSQDDLLVTMIYTHYHSRSYASLEKEGSLLPVWQHAQSPKALELGSSSKSSWKLDVDIADVDAGKRLKFYGVNVRPHAGIRSTFLRQKFDIDYTQYANEADAPASSSNHCLALGTRGGVDTSYSLGDGFWLFGDTALSWLFGYHNLHQKNSLSNGAAMAVMECSLGALYEKRFIKSICLLTVRVGYEFNHFLNQGSWAQWFSTMTNDATPESLSLEGLSWGFRLDF